MRHEIYLQTRSHTSELMAAGQGNWVKAFFTFFYNAPPAAEPPDRGLSEDGTRARRPQVNLSQESVPGSQPLRRRW